MSDEDAMIEVRLMISPQLIRDLEEPGLVTLLGREALAEARRIKALREAWKPHRSGAKREQAS